MGSKRKLATENNKKVIENIFWNGKGDAFKTTLF